MVFFFNDIHCNLAHFLNNFSGFVLARGAVCIFGSEKNCLCLVLKRTLITNVSTIVEGSHIKYVIRSLRTLS